jgi:corrinoid protein of di/trimethylamine methyltransferase
MMEKKILEKIQWALIQSEVEQVVALTEEAIAADLEPMKIIDGGLLPGMQVVGEKYECGEYFLPHLIIAADGMKKSMRLLEPELAKRNQQVKKTGIVVVGTVKGDIHEIGKTLVATLLSANGFEVHDLGVDVSVDEFVTTARKVNADVIGLSALLTTTMMVQKDVIDELEDSGLRSNMKVIVGGAPVTSDWAVRIGADGYAGDAVAAIALVKNLLNKSM